MDLICGINPVIEALQAGARHFDRLLVVKGIRNRRIADAIARASQRGIPLRFEARETLDRLAGGLPHQGVIGVVSAKPMMGLEDLLASAHEPGFVLALDGVQDPRNLGAILRSAEAAGADGVLLPERHSVGLNETVGRASAGAIEHVRVARIGNLVQALGTLKSRGYWIIGFDGGATERWDAIDYRRPVALVLGGEGRGIRRLVREHCDHLAALPLFGHVASLNVSVAAGVALYEVIRQRGSVPSHVRPIPPRSLTEPHRILGPSPEDGEHDPGLLVPHHAHDGGEPEEESVGTISIDEEAATGPTVLRHAGDRRSGLRPDRGRRRRAPSSRGTPAPTGPPRGGSQREPGSSGAETPEAGWSAPDVLSERGQTGQTVPHPNQAVDHDPDLPIPSERGPSESVPGSTPSGNDRRIERRGGRRRRRRRGRPGGDRSQAPQLRRSGVASDPTGPVALGVETPAVSSRPVQPETPGSGAESSPGGSPGPGTGQHPRRRRRRRRR